MSHNIEDIIPPSRRQSYSERSRNVAEKTSEFLSEKRRESSNKQPPKRRFAYTPAVVAIGVIIISIGVLFYFSGAEVTIVPRTNTSPLSEQFTATASSTGALPFSFITIDKRAAQYISASTTKVADSVATGEITIYNKRSASLHLIIKTRFKTLSGLVFYLRKPVTIPAGHGIIPGSITASVYASEPGNMYNVKSTFFTVPGLAGTSIANEIYAKSKSSMAGGAGGTSLGVSNKKELQVRSVLRKALEQSLTKDIASKIPTGYTFLHGAATTTYKTLPNKIATSTKNKTLMIQEEATITAILFKSTSLAKNIASKSVSKYEGIAPVYIKNPQSLIFTTLGTFPTTKTRTFRFMLSGEVTIVWLVDKNSVASSIAGKSHKEAQAVVSALPSVKGSYLVLRPFWINTFPKDPSKINVTISKP